MSKQHGLYGIFWSEGERATAMWAMERSKKRALRHARKLNAYVTRMNLPCGGGSWDAPTFKACSSLVADFRQ